MPTTRAARQKPLLILQMSTPPDDVTARFGEQGDWITRALADDTLPVRVVRPAAGEGLPAPDQVAGAVISGAWNMVTDREDWSERTAAWIRDAMAIDLPLLGICYGHQLMSHALGGVVDYHPDGLELGCYPVELIDNVSDDPVLSHLSGRFAAPLTHEQTVLIPPVGAQVLARSSHDPHQILRYGPAAWSVQFHPEFSSELLTACIVRREPALRERGEDVDAMLASVRACDTAREVLIRFARWSLAQQAVVDEGSMSDAARADTRQARVGDVPLPVSGMSAVA